MPTFQFEAMDATGAEIKDVIEAPTEEEAQATIRQMGYFVTKITAKKSSAA
jgi:type IV pilus assembly protein PilC